MPTYRSKQAVTLQRRERAYEELANLLLHLHSLNVNLISIAREADGFVTITTNDVLPESQLAHLVVDRQSLR